MLGNFLNASNHKGNAQGFKVTSINKLVDTKSSKSSSRTLLHFTAQTITQTMPEIEAFLDELAQPAEAFKGRPGSPCSHAPRTLTDAFVPQSIFRMSGRPSSISPRSKKASTIFSARTSRT